MEQEIDIVVTWVDGNDPAWLSEKEQYMAPNEFADAKERFRDWELLPYWFRGIEKNAPWVRKIHFITWGHIPAWLNTEHPKLHIVRHEDYIPKEYLPTFNCNVIELHMHRIEGLSEQFVYFNDDLYLLKASKPTDFFKDGKPVDMLAFQPVVANPQNPIMTHIYTNNSLVLSKYFNKRENIKKQPGSYFKIGYPLMYFGYNFLELAFPLFTGFYTVHSTAPFLKSTFNELWEKENALFKQVSKNRFRDNTDISQYLLREWQKLSGNFCPRNVQKIFQYLELSDDNTKIYDSIRKKKRMIVCLNDGKISGKEEEIKAQLREAFESVFPEKSSFEK